MMGWGFGLGMWVGIGVGSELLFRLRCCGGGGFEGSIIF